MFFLEISTLGVITITVIFLLVLTLFLVAILLFTKEKLSPSGPVKITINDEKVVEVNSGGTLLSTLGNEKIFLPSACGGGGTCIQCTCIVLEGGGAALPTETPHRSEERRVGHEGRGGGAPAQRKDRKQNAQAA